ncbi:MAG: ATP-binding protein [Anaerolineaceae bacterium]|nr:ATP-binding protein [Anaerolineaceae bacterium]
MEKQITDESEGETGKSHIADVQISLVRGIRQLLNSEAAILALIDHDNPENIILKKTLLDGDQWNSVEAIKLEPSLMRICLKGAEPVYLTEVKTSPSFDPIIDSVPGLTAENAFCMPLLTNSETLGGIEFLNMPDLPSGKEKTNLLRSLVKALATSIYSMHLIQQLKVTNADLEASHWELLYSRNMLRTLFDSISASLYIIDQRFTIIAVNLSRAQRLNQKPDQMVGQKCYQAMYQRSEPCTACRAKETTSLGSPTNRYQREWIDNDQAIDWEISTFPIQNNTGLPIQVIILEQDITEKRRLEANLIQNEKLAAVGQLAAGVAHEINNPLTAIVANAQMLKQDLPQENAELMESVELIEMAGNRASQVVRNLLGFARKDKIELTPIDLNETIRTALFLIQHELASRPITLKIDLPGDLPPISGSSEHLQGVWINIILNAIDAIENGQGTISISSRYTGAEFRVTIQDDGKGIPAERVQRIFEPFYTTKSLEKGTGLGLSVCHRFVKQHGGSIQVDSRVNVGTKFTILLPADEQ